MNIESVDNFEVQYITMKDCCPKYYQRFNSNLWLSLNNDSWEIINNPEKLEELYQQYILAEI